MKEANDTEYDTLWVEVVYWKRDKIDKRKRHVALGIAFGEEMYKKYVSYYPATQANYCNCWVAQGEFHTLRTDKPSQPPLQTDHGANHLDNERIKITGLDIKTILNKIRVIEESVKKNEGVWSLFSDFWQCNIFTARRFQANCCSLTMLLLKEGGLSKLLPGFNQLGSLKHILVLSTRIFSMAPWYSQGIYQIILDSHTHYNSNSAILPMLLLSLLNGVPLFLIERKWYPRELIENNNGDYFVSYFSSVSCLLTMIAYRKWIVPALSGLPFWKEFLFDLAGSFLFAFVFFLMGAVGGKLVYSVLGMEYINTPIGVRNLAVYLNKLNRLSIPLKNTLFHKEAALFLIYVMNYFTVYLTRKLILERFASVCAGYSLGLVSSFCVIKLIHYRLDKRHLEATDEEKQFLNDYSTPVNSLFFKLFLSIFFSFLGTRFLLSLSDENPWLLSLFTIASSFSGYLLAIGLLKFGDFVHQKIKKHEISKRNVRSEGSKLLGNRSGHLGLWDFRDRNTEASMQDAANITSNPISFSEVPSLREALSPSSK